MVTITNHMVATMNEKDKTKKEKITIKKTKEIHTTEIQKYSTEVLGRAISTYATHIELRDLRSIHTTFALILIHTIFLQFNTFCQLIYEMPCSMFCSSRWTKTQIHTYTCNETRMQEPDKPYGYLACETKNDSLRFLVWFWTFLQQKENNEKKTEEQERKINTNEEQRQNEKKRRRATVQTEW